MSSIEERFGSRPVPKLLFWIPILVCDALVLAGLSYADYAVLALLALFAAFFVRRHPTFFLALGIVGTPLLDPLTLVTGSDRPGWVLGRALILVPLLFLAAERALGLGRGSWSARSWLRSPITWGALGLGIVLRHGLAFTPSPAYGAMKVFFYAAMNLLALAGAALLLRDRRRDPPEDGIPRTAARFLAAVVICQIAIAVAAVWNAFTGYYRYEGRLTTLGINTIWLSRHMGLGILCLLALHALGRVRLRWVILGVLLMGWVFVQSRSRGPILALSLSFLFWLILKPGRSRRAGWALLFAGAGAAVALLPVFYRNISGGLLPSFERGLSNLIRMRLLTVVRESVGQVGWSGVGTGGFSRLVNMGDSRMYPHNLFLEVLLENGYLGLLVLLVFVGAVLAAWIAWGRRVRPAGEGSLLVVLHRAVGVLFFYSMLNAQVSGDITANEWIWLWAGALVAWAPIVTAASRR